MYCILRNVIYSLLNLIESFLYQFFIFSHYKSYLHLDGLLSDTSFKFIGGGNSCLIHKRARLISCQCLLSEGNTIEVGELSRLWNVSFHILANHSRVIIGKNCTLSNLVIWMEDENNLVIIGDNTYIGGAHLAVTGSGKTLEIGSNCLFSDGITVRTGDSHAIIDAYSGKKINPEASIRIDQHVWVGQNVTILKGLTIQKDCVIGSCSVVTKDIPSGSIVAGNPAKVVKSGISWSTNREL